MAIAYPLALPTSIGIANITLSANNAVAISQSPFTFQQQIVQHPGQRWTASVSIPPVRRDLAEPWNAFLLALNGPVGTFLLGDPNAKNPRGSALGFTKNKIANSNTPYSENFGLWSFDPDGASGLREQVVGKGPFTQGWRIYDGSTTQNTAVSASFSAGVLSSGKYVQSFFFSYDFLNPPSTGVSLFSIQGTGTTAAFRVNWNLDGTIASVVSGGGATEAVGFEDLGDGLYRGWARGTLNSSAHVLYCWPASFVGGGVSTGGIILYGAQVEESPSGPSDYQSVFGLYGPFVNGASQTGSSLNIDGASPSESGYLLAGDYIQLGSGATATLHKVLQDVSTNESGQATIDIWPNIRTAPADNALITLTNTVGRFRLSGNQQSFSINDSSIYGISFDCVEAI